MSQLSSFWSSLKKVFSKPRTRLFASAVIVGFISIVRGSELALFLALVPLVAYTAGSKELSAKMLARDFYLYSVIVCGFANLFLFQLAPENWNIPISPWMSIFARFVSWIIMCALVSISFALLGWILAKFKPSSVRVAALLLLFPIAELFRSYLYAIVSYGPGASLSPNYNWGSLAVSVAATPLVYLSRFIGFFGLSFMALFLAAVIYYLLKSRKPLYVGGLVIVAIVTYGAFALGNGTDSKTLLVSVLHLGEKEDARTLDQKMWPSKGTDLFVLPEYSDFGKNPQASPIADRLSARGVGITTIVNGPSPTGTNQLQIFDKQNSIVIRQDKTFLIPNGEFLPYLLQAIFWTVGKQHLSLDFKYTQQIKPGAAQENTYSTAKFRVGALACSGVSALNEYGRLSQEGADILVNSASLAFFTNKSFYHTYAFNMARYHAVSNNKPFVQASRSGESYILDKQGKIIKRWSDNRTHLLTAQVEL